MPASTPNPAKPTAAVFMTSPANALWFSSPKNINPQMKRTRSETSAKTVQMTRRPNSKRRRRSSCCSSSPCLWSRTAAYPVHLPLRASFPGMRSVWFRDRAATAPLRAVVPLPARRERQHSPRCRPAPPRPNLQAAAQRPCPAPKACSPKPSQILVADRSASVRVRQTRVQEQIDGERTHDVPPVRGFHDPGHEAFPRRVGPAPESLRTRRRP